MDGLTGNLTPVQVVETENPSFLAVDPTRQYLYAANELGVDAQGKALGRVSAYEIDKSTGKLNFLNTELTDGTWPCHVWVHPTGEYLMAANYGSGDYPVYPLLDNGKIGKMTDSFLNKGNGTGPDDRRQGGPHAHMILTNPSAQHVFGVDLGADRIISLKLDLATGKFKQGTVPYANVASGTGPRHMDFHPSEKYAYAINELSSTVDVFEFDAEHGSFVWVQTVSTLPQNSGLVRPKPDPNSPGTVAANANSTAEIRVHSNGKFLYGTNRGMDTVVVYSIDENTGKLEAVDWVSTNGEMPRGMNIDPSGSFLYAANMNSDTIAVYKINALTGELNKPLHMIDCPVPVDIIFGPQI